MAIVTVIWGVALLSTIAVSFLWTATGSHRLVRNSLDLTRMEALSEAAVHRAALGLLESRPAARWRRDGVPYEFSFDGIPITVRVQDELGRIDVNRADGSLLIRLFESAGLDAQSASVLVDRILDWRDTGPLKRLNGAKEREYRDAGYAYRPRSGAFQSLDELKLVLGMTPDLFRRVERALTIYSGRQFIDAAVAPREVLLALPNADGSSVDGQIASRTAETVASALPLPGRAFTVATRFHQSDRTVGHDAVIRMTDDPVKPFWILSWKVR